VHGALWCKVNGDSVSLKLLDGTKYNWYTNHPDSIGMTGEQVTLLLVKLDKAAFGDSLFKIKDSLAFGINVSRKAKYIKITNQTSSNATSNNASRTSRLGHWEYYDYSFSYVTYEPNLCGCDATPCPDGSMHEEYHTENYSGSIWVEDGNWYDPPAGGSGGGGGGGNGTGGSLNNDLPYDPVGNDPLDPIPNPGLPVYNPLHPFDNSNNSYDAPDDPVIQQSLIEIGNIIQAPNPPLKRIGKTPNRNNTEDMTYGNTCDASGILSNMPNFTDAQLFDEMSSLMHTFSIFDGGLRGVGDDMVQKFKNKSGGIYSDATLNQRVAESSTFKNFIIDFGIMLNQSLASANWNIANVGEIDIPLAKRPVFNGLRNKFHGLQILINDTEQTEIYLNGFTINPVTHKWTALITVKIKDHFGLDKNDALTYQDYNAGFAAWWILQHCRGYVPFETNISFTMSLVCNP